MSYGFPGTGVLTPGLAPGLAPMTPPLAAIRIGEQALWSAHFYADASALASTTNRVFTTPIGQTGQGFAAALSIAETNLKVGGFVPAQQAFDIFAVATQVYYSSSFPVVGADLRNVLNHCVILWDFTQTQIPLAPVQLIGAGGGVYGSTADTGAAEGGTGGSRIALNNGNGAVWIYRLHPVMLSGQAQFSLLQQFGSSAIVVDGGSGDSGLVLRNCLIGRFQNAISIG